MKEIELNCCNCNNKILRKIQDINKNIKRNCKLVFCSHECRNVYKKTKLEIECTFCKKKFERQVSQIKKSLKHFCSLSCAATFNNTHKTIGNRRSKLEVYLEQQLISLYPNIDFHFNKKDAINSELDIYIPSLKLAFELNGIFHYEPIFGSDKLNQVKNNDHRKFQACLEQKISLCIIDVSTLKNFKIKNANKFLDIIQEIITNKLK